MLDVFNVWHQEALDIIALASFCDSPCSNDRWYIFWRPAEESSRNFVTKGSVVVSSMTSLDSALAATNVAIYYGYYRA